jgi:hypothetical protein
MVWCITYLIWDNCWGDPWIHTVTFHLDTPPTNPSKFAVYLNENAGLPLVAKPLVAPPAKQASRDSAFNRTWTCSWTTWYRAEFQFTYKLSHFQLEIIMTHFIYGPSFFLSCFSPCSKTPGHSYIRSGAIDILEGNFPNLAYLNHRLD